MPIDFSSQQPAYLQIADELRAMIENGQLRPGEQVPARKALAAQYGVAPETIKKAQDELAREGLIGTHSTRGIFVLKTPDEPVPSPEYLQVMAHMKQLNERLDSLETRMTSLEGEHRGHQ